MKFTAEERTARKAVYQSLSHAAPLCPHASRWVSEPTDEQGGAQGAANTVLRDTGPVRGRVQTPELAAISALCPKLSVPITGSR